MYPLFQQTALYRTTSLPPCQGHHFPAPEDILHLMDHLADQIQSSKSALTPIELAAMAYKRLVDIQPYAKGNEEAALQLMNLILTDAGYSSITIPEDKKAAYDYALSASRQQKDMEPFSRFIAECMV